MVKEYQKLTLRDVENVPLGNFIDFCGKAYHAQDNDVLQLGEHLLLVADSRKMIDPCLDCALGGDKRLCRIVPCLGSSRPSGVDVRYLALLAKGGDNVLE